MSLFKKSQDKIEAEKLYSLLSDKTMNFTEKEIKETIKLQGYNDNVGYLVLKIIKNNKLPLKKVASLANTKEYVLSELSKSINSTNSAKNNLKKELVNKTSSSNKLNVKEEKPKTEIKKNLSNVNKVGFFKKTGNFFKKGYFFFEDNYYKMIDGISKVIPVNKLTDRIDKVFPSFILFLLILALLLYLILSGTLSFSKSWTIGVDVYDPAGVPLNGALVTFQINDENISFLTTNVFGEAIFKDLKSKKQNVNLIVSKEHYTTLNHSFKLSKNSLRQTVTLLIDLDSPLLPVGEEEEREIMFVENNDILILNTTLNIVFSCTNNEKIPTPKNTLIANGRITVKTPAACGRLRVSVTSNKFSSITNKVIGSNNKVVLTRITSDIGKLGFSVKNISGDALLGSDVTVYNYSQSNFILPLDNKQTDIYGLGEFSLDPKQYLLTVTKEGYLTYPKKGPLTVFKEETINTSFVLFTRDDLINFDCTLPKYSNFCVAGVIDCNNEHLKPFLNINSDGICILGTTGYISVTLKDANTSEPVFGDITLESKLKDTNESYVFTEYIAEDTNYYSFNVINFYDYRVRIINTEINGYNQPDPVLVTSLDRNIIIPLEFSSELNSGKIGVNVKDNIQNISNARVYLYREVDNNFVLTNPVSKFTNQFGDVNFELQRAHKNYYAYAVHGIVDREGTSSTEELDVNAFLPLFVNLQDIPKILNLKVTPNINFDINFYDVEHNSVIDYVSVDVDSNIQYYFIGGVNRVYAVISTQGYTTYQTEVLTLVPDQEIFKEVSLTSLVACSDSKLELTGLYNKTGTRIVTNIDYNNNGLDDEYRLKFKYTSCFSDSEIKYLHLRAGNEIFIDDDYIYFVSDDILSDEIQIDRGYKFSGEHIPDFNITLFNQNYTTDQGYDYNGNKYKWFEVNVMDLSPNVLEFSANIKFKEAPVAPTDFYKLSYRSLATKYGEIYNFDPIQSISWNEVPIYPDGYFYSKTNKYQIPFNNLDYIYSKKIKDFNGTVLTPYVDGYSVSIETNYKYDIYYLYLKNLLRQGSIDQTSSYTNNNLEYASYGYLLDSGDPDGNMDPIVYYQTVINDYNYSINLIDANRGYNINTYTIFKPTGFFENTAYSEPVLSTDILNNFPIINTSLYSYYSDVNFVFEITSNLNNDIFIGQNNVSFKVVDNYNAPIENILIKYQVTGGEAISLGDTDAQGLLTDQNIYLPVEDMSKKINFYFIFTPEAGFINNTVVRSKTIESGYSILENNINLSTYFYRLNDSIIFGDVNLENYNILKQSTVVANLNDLTFTGASSVFDVNQIKSNLFTVNDLPKDINQVQTLVLTSLVLNDDISTGVDINESYTNHLKFNDDTTLLLDVNSNIVVQNLGSINYSASYPNPNKGVRYSDENEVYDIEIIKDINPSIVIDYNLSSDVNAVLKNIIVDSLPLFIDNSVFNDSINLNNQNILSSVLIPINFKFNDAYTGDYPTNNSAIVLTFNILLNGNDVNFTQTFNVKAYNSESIVNISHITWNSVEIFCISQDECSQSKIYSFNNNLNLYKVKLLTPVSLNPIDENLSVNNLSSELSLITTDITRSVTYNSNFSDLSLDETTGIENTLFNFKVLDILNSDFNKNVLADYTIFKLDPEITQSTIDFDYCIGVGGQNDGTDMFILGYCQDQTDSCKTGLEYLPKVFFNWGEEYEEGGWTNKCIGNNVSEMYEKYACDSLQMLISIFYKIQNCVEGPFYIKLMNDGISDNLLKDFIDYRDNDAFSQFSKFSKPNNSNLFTESSVNDGDLKITFDNNSTQKTFMPGIYKVDVYGNDNDYYQNSMDDTKIDIQLLFVKNLSSSELSAFHYMPFDGRLNQNGTRDGYGIQTNNYDPIIQIRSDSIVDLNYSLVNNPINTLAINNYNSLGNLNNIIDSEGYILDLKKFNDGQLQMTYSLSYPIPLYSYAACLLNSKLSYNLLHSGDNSLDPLIGSNFLKWTSNDIVFIDNLYSSDDIGRYILDTSTVTDNNISLTTMLYIPTDLDLSQFKFKTSQLSNSDFTKIFSKSNLIGNVEDITFKNSDHNLGNNLNNLKTIKGIFEFVKNEKACIHKSPQRTYIKWVDSEVNFTQNELDIIISNIPSDYICPVINNT